jgi:hypothetical protein
MDLYPAARWITGWAPLKPVRAKRITLGHLNVPDPTGMNKLVSAEVFGGLPAQLRPC